MRTPSRRPRRLCLERLEDRSVPTVFTVTSTAINFTVDSQVTLLEALQAANNDTAAGDAPAGSGADTILFDPNLNGQTITLAGVELFITGDVTITGPGADLLTISGNNASRIFTVDNFATSMITVRVSGLTLTNGRAGSGGAILNREVLTVDDSVLSANTVVASGGFGGAIANFGSLTVTSSTLSDNSVLLPGGDTTGAGGGISNRFGGAVFVSDSILVGNAAASGGGIATEAFLKVERSTVSGNSAVAGGGVYANSSTSNVAIVDSTLSANAARDFGGSLYLVGLGTINTSTLVGNFARYGGGVYISLNGSANVYGSTLSGNAVTVSGGGIYNGGTLVACSSTVYANTADLEGGGIANIGVATTLQSTIVAGNSAGTSGPDVVGPVKVAFSLLQRRTGASVSETTPGSTLYGVDPLLGPLADNGGPTLTHALLPGSPALDRGSNPLLLAVDQRGAGFARTVGLAADIGATEARFADVRLVPDPRNRVRNVLVVIGTRRADTIVVTRDDEDVEVEFNGEGHAFPRAAVSRLVAFGMEGADTIAVQSTLALDALLDGGLGADRLYGGAGHDLLLGQAGTDFLVGREGRDFLVGGAGADQLAGGGGDDLLVGGATLYETQYGITRYLEQIHAVWKSADTYANRVTRIRTGVGVPRLDLTAVRDTAFDTLAGDGGVDWFFRNAGDLVRDRTTGERLD